MDAEKVSGCHAKRPNRCHPPRIAHGLDAKRLQYIEAHATSTQVGDATEITALTDAMQGLLAAGQRVPIGASKGNIGHSLETAGIAGLTKVVLALENAVIPPAVNIETLNPKIAWDKIPFYVPTKAEAWPEHRDGHQRRGQRVWHRRAQHSRRG